jgi:outer membrane protein OmpA-like peptidoglycan-associated protein
MYLLKGNIKQSKNLPMVSKKLKLLLALVGLMQTASFAQSTDANWAYDSTKASNKVQYNEFANYQTPYPSKPRGQWELSVNGGNVIIIGDRPMLNGYTGGMAGGISGRFALSHVFSARIGYEASAQKIPGYKTYIPFSANTTHMINLDLIASLNTISSYRGNPKVNYYVFAGYSLAASQVSKGVAGNSKFDGPVYNGSNSSVPNLYAKDNKNFIKTFHKDYAGNDNQALYHNLAFGAGIDFRVSPKITLGVEERIVAPLTGIDMLDGYINQEGSVRGGADKFAFSTAKIGFDIGNTKTHTAPLWWINPNNYIYNEVATPKHMKLPPVVLPDADGDGVTDQFDMEPNTPAGCAVDSHGVSLDTDGDGVPDCRDKEKLTPANCFPVNADGVGTCPEPECCKNLQVAPATCSLGSLPSVQFKAGSATLSTTAKSLLDNVAQQLMANPNCKVKLVGYGASDKKSQQLSWDHVNAIKTYLTEQKGISETRIIWSSGVEGNNTTVDLVPTMEEGPNTVPAPHPNLSKKG